MTQTHRLTQSELETVVAWFVHRMPSDMRGELMADLPQHYVKLHPGVDRSAVLARVADKMARTEVARRDAMAAELDGAYPSPADISYDDDSRWCQEHGHTGLLVDSVCEICDRLVRTDPRFATALRTDHNPDGSRKVA